MAKDVDTSEIYSWDHTNLEHFKSWSSTVDNFIMHNGISFDAPNLNRLLHTNIKLSQIKDTMIMSQLFDPIREDGHSLSAWGNRLGFSKMECDNFSEYTLSLIHI